MPRLPALRPVGTHQLRPPHPRAQLSQGLVIEDDTLVPPEEGELEDPDSSVPWDATDGPSGWEE